MADQHKAPSPFAPAEPLTAERLEAYLKGTLSPAEMHDVELHLEQDSLHREAMEGFMENPDAPLPAAQLGSGPTGFGGPRWPSMLWLLPIAILPMAWLAYSMWKGSAAVADQVPEASTGTPYTAPETSADDPGVAATMPVELPESLHIGHDPEDRHMLYADRDLSPVDRHNDVDPIQQRGPDPGSLRPTLDARPLRRARSSRQLVFLHGLKLVHPSELHARVPLLDMEHGGVPARYASADEPGQDQVRQRMMGYLEFMDAALARFAQSDHRACLEDMRFLLAQYPNDVNAQFYAGLCAYNMGQFEQARRELQRASVHEVDCFDEEAAWYHALALERTGASTEAQAAFTRIAAGGGFYAERAKARQRGQ